MPSLIVSAERYFRSKSAFSKSALLFLQGMKNIILSGGHEKVTNTEAFGYLKKNLDEAIRLNPNDLLLKNFDFMAWLDSKIQRRSFSEVLKEKRKNNTPGDTLTDLQNSAA